MPSAEVRRNTRVFGTRSLRSGSLVCTVPDEMRHMRTKDGEQWIELLENPGDVGGDAAHCKENCWNLNGGAPEQEVSEMDVNKEVETQSQSDKVVHEGLVMDNNVRRRWGIVYSRKRKKVNCNLVGCSSDVEEKERLVDKMYGIVYSRKRKKVNCNLVDCSSNVKEKQRSVDKMYGKHFVRRKWKKKIRQPEIVEACDSSVRCVVPEESHYNARCQTLLIIVKPFCISRHELTCFLNSVFRYLRRARIEIQQLSAFVFSKTIAHDSNVIPEHGVCMTWDVSFMPVFSVDFSAVPFCFTYLHSTMQLRFFRLTCILGIYSSRKDEKDDSISTSFIHNGQGQEAGVVVTSGIDYSGKKMESPSNINATMLACQTVQLRNGHNIQKRSSSRSKRGRPPSAFGVRKANGALASNLHSFIQDSVQLPSMLPNRELRSSAQRNTCANIKQIKSAVVGLAQAVDPTGCYANILIMEADKCYREEGALVTLEVSAKKQWHLAIKRDGAQRFSLIAQKVMKQCSCNRFTRAIMWTADNGWKLEFPDRREWLIFKELYKECSHRNVQVPVESFIPIPGVHEVPDWGNSNCDFARPGSYITVKDDELTRALTRRSANYDMDSDDEEWLNKLNTRFLAEKENHKLLSDEIFEFIIDAFERVSHCNLDSDKTTVPNICINVDRRVVEAVHSHWIRKRRQKQSALVRVFKCYRPRISQRIPKSVLRKKRSFKRQ